MIRTATAALLPLFTALAVRAVVVAMIVISLSGAVAETLHSEGRPERPDLQEEIVEPRSYVHPVYVPESLLRF